jgi:flagellar motor switch protein FliG
LEPVTAAQVLQLLQDTQQADILLRIATMADLHPEAVSELEGLLQIKLSSKSAIKYIPIGGTQLAAKIMNNVSRGTDQRIMSDLEARSPDILTEIQDQMLVFENLNMLDEKSLQTLMRAIDSALLVAALKGADERLRDRMLGCMSQRAAQTVLDEMETGGPIRVSDVQEAQRQILVLARQLSDDGQIMLGGKGEDYV